MSHRTRTGGAIAAAGATALSLLLLPGPGASVGADAGSGSTGVKTDVGFAKHGDVVVPAAGSTPPDGTCQIEQQYLPHTADAIEGWYRACTSRR